MIGIALSGKVCLLVAVLTGACALSVDASSVRANTQLLKAQPPDVLTADERVNVNVYKIANKSVVYITTVSPTADMFFQVVPAEGEGTGSILTSDGYILTNYHVVKDAHSINVTLWDGSTLPAQLTGADPEYDTAVLKINPGNQVLVPIALADSARLEVGRRVFVIGAPFGFDHTMTTGIVSNTSRSLTGASGRVVKGIIQTDAPINPGNSGGPLLNTRGEMVGLTTAIYSKLRQGSAQWGGIGFAIPINVVKQIFPQLIAHHHVSRPDLGITKFNPLNGGLQVVEVDPKGPAAQAGISGIKVIVRRQGPFTIQSIDADSADIITRVDNTSVKTIDDLLSYIESKKAGQVVIVTLLRQGKILKLPVKLTSSSPASAEPNDQ